MMEQANTYFSSEVLHSGEWDLASDEIKQKALNNAENQLYRRYTNYDKQENPIDEKAIYEQALWLLRLDDSIRKAEQGVRQISVEGVTISLDGAASYIAPEVKRILGNKTIWTVM